MKYCVINIQWHQYIVKEWDTLNIDKYDRNKNEQFKINEVLMCFDDDWDKCEIWTPYLTTVNVLVTCLDDIQGDKLRVLKYKRKTRYQRVIWFRAKKTVLKIDKINYE